MNALPEPTHLPELISEKPVVGPADCLVEAWLDAVPAAVQQHVQQYSDSGEYARSRRLSRNTQRVDARTDQAEAEQLLAVLREFKVAACGDCPKTESCESERFLEALHKTPLRRGAAVVVAGYFAAKEFGSSDHETA